MKQISTSPTEDVGHPLLSSMLDLLNKSLGAQPKKKKGEEKKMKLNIPVAVGVVVVLLVNCFSDKHPRQRTVLEDIGARLLVQSNHYSR